MMMRSKITSCLLAVLALLLAEQFQAVSSQITNPTEVEALKAIRKSLQDPQGRLRSWNNGDPCKANWTGVICHNSSISDDGYLHVKELQLLKMNLSGALAPELGQLTYMEILDVMWNQITGSIPKEVGNVKTLKLLLVNGNQLTGSLPEELGYLPVLDRIQIDQNQISGPIPKSFAYLNKTKHFHMNNNSLSGQIPPELSRLPSLVHLLLDNNNLSGYLPPELSKLPNLLIIQLDNNNFSGSSIPATYSSMTKLLKMSLRNCSLQGSVPDLSGIPQLGYIDVSWNQLTGPIPTNRLANNMTTIDLSHNFLNGSIPANFSGLPKLQRLSLENNDLSGSVPSDVWQNISFAANGTLSLDFQNNRLTTISSSLAPPPNVTILLYGNPVCSSSNSLGIQQFCQSEEISIPGSTASNQTGCGPCPTDLDYEMNPLSPIQCLCAIPFGVGYRLKSPGFSDFRPYETDFQDYLTSGLSIDVDQLWVASFMWEEGPRLQMELKFFPNRTVVFGAPEVLRITSMFTGWSIPDSDIYGPYELLNISLGYYQSVLPQPSRSGLSSGSIAGIVLGCVAAAAILSSIVTLLILRKRLRYGAIRSSKNRSVSKILLKIDGVKMFTFEELVVATENFSEFALVGQGGYGKVYRGVLADGTVAAIKRAQQGSLQGSKEFCTEIELLSRLHHRNLVALLGYCDEEDEQMLVYEFMPNGTLRDHLSFHSKEPLSFAMRLRIALGSASGILYLHTEADPPIFHRDIKASNILLDAKYNAKVADFGLSRLAVASDIEGTAPGHVSTVVKGTPGYLDPEYFLTHKLTDKSDVYSLGVVFLEMLTGMHPISHGKNIVREVTTACQSGTIFSVVDDRMGTYPREAVEKFAVLALRCCRDEPDGRPSVKEVYRELEAIWRMLPEADLGTLLTSDSAKGSTPASSSVSKMPSENQFTSTEISGADLLSSVLPSIDPR